jgi:hypothetical protein
MAMVAMVVLSPVFIDSTESRKDCLTSLACAGRGRLNLPIGIPQ